MIALDTMILVYGFERTGDTTRVTTASRFIQQLRNGNEQVGIPSPAITELLARTNPDRHDQILSELLSGPFLVYDVDVAAAKRAAVISFKHLDRVRKSGGEPKQCLKFDALILGVALANSARAIVTEDSRALTSMAADEPIQVIGLDNVPLTPIARDLFLDSTGT